MANENRILSKMLERLFASLVNGPSLNCRPHSSRQRVDWTGLSKLGDMSPEEALRVVLGGSCEVRLNAKVKMPRGKREEGEDETANGRRGETATEETSGGETATEEVKSPGESEGLRAWNAWEAQVGLLSKLRGIVEDARTYEQDTGVHVLNIGFPILSMPPVAGGGRSRSPGKRIVAPVAFVPVNVVVKSGAGAGVVISCKREGIDRVTPNSALLAWIEQQTGKRLEGELFADEEGSDPWREIGELVRYVCGALEMGVPKEFVEEKREAGSEKREIKAGASGPVFVEEKPVEDSFVAQPNPEPRSLSFELSASPRADEADESPQIYLSAVLGLFPMANQGLLRDMQAMASGEQLAGPVTSFVQANVSLDAPVETAAPDAPTAPVVRKARVFAQERMVAGADPCQARAVKMARRSRGLVIHGPPGTGKSQTITNIIGDHLSRGDRVLLVSDKRTALDVVANRLEHMGLGPLVALIHDPQRDQRDLYRTIREQLEVLAETQTNEKAQKQLDKVDTELQELHGELTGYWDALMYDDPAVAGASFHELVGRWLAIEDSPEYASLEGMGAALALEEIEQHEHLLTETVDRCAKVAWWENPWREAAGVELGAFVATPMDKWREAIGRCVEPALAADATIDPAIPPFVDGVELREQAKARKELAERLSAVISGVSEEVRQRWAGKDAATQERMRKRLAEVAAQIEALHAGPLDADLAMIARERNVGMAQIAFELGNIEGYLDIARKWHAFFQFGRKKLGRQALSHWGLALSADNAERLKKFLWALRARLVLQKLHYELYGVPEAVGMLSDEVLERTLAEHGRVFDLLAWVRGQASVSFLCDDVVGALVGRAPQAERLNVGLQRSPGRVEAMIAALSSLSGSKLILQEWITNTDRQLRKGGAVGPTVQALAERVEEVESILRIRAGLTKLPAGIAAAVRKLVARAVEAETALGAIRKAALAAFIARRLAEDPRLQSVDGQRVSSAFERYRELEEKKRKLVREVILHQWTSKQKERLLAQTGSRLNSLGAELKRRLTMRGERAMRLRQVLAVGQNTPDGDPLFDVCPVWMASPETVAQLFPRREVFAVVIFDEASQCRLEETLPVLTRGQRVVIAGDPKQLPPTRFFESAVAQNEDEEIETDQQLFEAQQGEIEDLLGAALNLEIDQCYLDVHYRSKSAELIEFSNEHFYGSRLQAIPGHPDNRPETAPLVLHRVSGIYEKRQNEAEADAVVTLVQEMLRPKETPSIGIACFNLQQRDLIVEKLDELAAEDEKFGRKLEEARQRSGVGSFEGLFVKNLENVQGDERDVIIISTTYGPDKSGRFYRRFGPLGRAGGGRRLNVLVTRARQEVHLVTSIPAEVYRALPPVPAGQVPTGGWLLFAYLKYAEEVGKTYATPEHEESAPSTAAPEVAPVVLPTKHPSSFAVALANRLAKEHGIISDVYWGNDGFCVDVALHDRTNPAAVTRGVLVDATRFSNVEDPVEWDVFRTGIHEDQGWKLTRIWSPHFFRDPKGVMRSVVKGAE